MDGFASTQEQLESLIRAQPLLVAVLRNRQALYQLHDKERPAHIGRTTVENAGDVRMIHHGQRLTFCLEAGHDVLGGDPDRMIFSATFRMTGSVCSAT